MNIVLGNRSQYTTRHQIYIVNLLASSNTAIALVSYMNSSRSRTKFTDLPRETSLNLSKIEPEASVAAFTVK
jgi:hypothetical protein